jgi:hypothetical protein
MSKIFKQKTTSEYADEKSGCEENAIETFYRREALLFCLDVVSSRFADWSCVIDRAMKDAADVSEQTKLGYIKSLLVMLSDNAELISEWKNYHTGLANITDKLLPDKELKYKHIIAQLSYFDTLFPESDEHIREIFENIRNAK